MSCCQNKACDLETMNKKQAKVLWIVLAINALFFLIELVGGIMVHSTSILADSLEMLGDSIVYAFSIFVIYRGKVANSLVAMAKGVIMLLFGAFVLSKVIFTFFNPIVPIYTSMGTIAFAALIANAICFWLLYQYRDKDLNMRSTWLCSRNDVIANVSIIFSAYLVSITNSVIPDIAVGLLLTFIFISTAIKIIRESIKNLNKVTV